jgi:hypothetical protein
VGDSDNRNNLSIAASNTSVDSSTASYLCSNSAGCADTSATVDYAIEVKREDSGSVWDVGYEGLRDGTYYFHAKSKDRAGNWGDTSHYMINIDTAGVAVDILSPVTGQLFSDPNVTVIAQTGEQANVTVIALHPDGSNSTSDYSVFTGTHAFNVTLGNGTNDIYAIAINPANGVVTYSNHVFVRLGLSVPTGNRTLKVNYQNAGALSSHIRGVVEGALVTVGMASENTSAVWAANSIYSDTGRMPIKIFMTRSGMDTSGTESDLAADDFLDRINPLFGYRKSTGEYVVSTEVRYPNAYLEGERTVGAGKYTLVFRNIGVTPDGRVNVSVRII